MRFSPDILSDGDYRCAHARHNRTDERPEAKHMPPKVVLF